MTDAQLDRYLRSVGKECFVTYFEVFNDRHLENRDIAEKIYKERGYTWNACNSRTGHARMIINAGRAKDALMLVANSKHWSITSEIKARALTLAECLCKS